jgi:TonB-linked SusC/RagA family outer membrane protein
MTKSNKMNNRLIRRHRIHLKGISVILVPLLFLVLISFSLTAQQGKMTVTGRISDENGEPMIGVNVLIKNTMNGTITDVDGKYRLLVAASDTLSITFIGYRQEIIPVRGRTVINLRMSADVTDLEEVVVVGYGEVKRANLLGSIASLSAKEIEDIPVTNMTNLFEGRLAGVHVSPAQPTGNPGASTRVRIRTETTFGTAGASGGAKDPAPLYIVDGFEVSQEEFDVLDPSEIESYSILKDASAAVYGSKGANGVVLVKTKRGKEGKLRVNYSGSHGIMDATMQTEMLSAYDLGRMINAVYINDSTKRLSDSELQQMKNVDYNWLDEAWQKSMISRHTINFSGGTDKIKYYAGGTYVYTEGNFPEMGVGKFSYRLGLDANITKDIVVSATIALDNKDFKRPYISGTGTNTMEDFFQQLLQAPKWTPAYINGYPVGNGLSSNPLYLFQTKSYKRNVDKGNTINLKVAWDVPWIKGLNTSATYSRREGHGYSKDYQIPYTLYKFEYQSDNKYLLGNNIAKTVTIKNNDRISESYGYDQNYQLNLNLNYKNRFGLHDISSFLTYEQSEGNAYSFSGTAEGIQTYGLEIQDAFLTESTSGNRSESGDLGAVFRFNYSYADRYLFESALRYEATTLFAPGERDALFPSASVGWVATEGDFFKNKLSFFDFFKIRYSIGLTGYSSISPWEYELKYNLSSSSYLFGGDSPYGGLVVGGQTDVASTGVSWEKSFMQNLGLDMKFLNNKLSVTIDGYYTYQYDILDSRLVTFPETAGLGKMPSENIGRLKAWGYETTIGYRGKAGKEFSWDVNAIFGFSTNRILERPTSYIPADYRYPIGQATNAAGREEGYLSEGIIRTQAKLDAINAEWNTKWGHDYIVDGQKAVLGSLYIKDIGRPGNTGIGETPTVFEPDGYVSKDYDKTYLERVNDHFVWKNLLPSNISLGAGWKDIKISMLFSMAWGIGNQVVDKLARTVASVSVSGGEYYVTNVPAFWKDFWTPDNPDAAYPNPYCATTNQWVTSFWMKDVVQLRLKNLNISYNVPPVLSKKWGIPELRIYFVGTNLWSPVTTFDYKEDAISRFNTYPLLKTFSFGLNLKI